MRKNTKTSVKKMFIVSGCDNQGNYYQLFETLPFLVFHSSYNGRVFYKCTLDFVMKDLFFFQESVFPNIHTRQKAAQVRSCKY